MDDNASTSNFGLVADPDKGYYTYSEEEASDILTAFGLIDRPSSNPDWDRDWDQVHPKVLIGGIYPYNDSVIQNLADAGVTDVFDCRREGRSQARHVFGRLASLGINYHWEPTGDDRQDKTKEVWLYRAIPKIVRAARREGSLVLSHCAAGYNRGPSLGIAALRGLGMTHAESCHAIRTNRQVGLLYERDVATVYEILKRRGRV